MARYGEIAKKAAKHIMFGNINSRDGFEKAWYEAAREVSDSEDTINKSCPQKAFLGLILKTEYVNRNGRFSKNAKYVLDALEILKQNPDADKNKNYLWNMIGNANVRPNEQMDVLLSLWEDEKLRKYFLL